MSARSVLDPSTLELRNPATGRLRRTDGSGTTRPERGTAGPPGAPPPRLPNPSVARRRIARGCCLLVSSVCLALVVPAVAQLAQRPWSLDAPFRGLHAIERVTTSNDEYSISLYWSPERFRIDYPDSRGPFGRNPADPADLYTALSIFCRADGRRERLSGPRPLGANLSLPMHPAAPAVYSVLHPMYWLLGLTGREFERVPVRVDLAGATSFDAELVRRRIAYGRPRPDIEIDLPGAAVLSVFITGSPMRVAVSGDGVDIRLWFPSAADLVGPAERMSAHCPPSPER